MACNGVQPEGEMRFGSAQVPTVDLGVEYSYRKLPIPLRIRSAVRKALDIHSTPSLRRADPSHAANDEASIRKVIRKVVVARRSVSIFIMGPVGTEDDHHQNQSTGSEDHTITFSVALDLVEKSGVTRIVANGDAAGLFEKTDGSLVNAIARAHSWKKQLLNGDVRSVKEIAQKVGVTGRYVSRILRFAFLAPDIIEAILDGRQPPSLSVERLREPIPYDWAEQRRLLGFRTP